MDASIDVTIGLWDLEEAPEFAEDAITGLDVDENKEPGQAIGAPFTATDSDDDALIYSLDSGDGASFDIDESGQIRTKEPLNYETKDTYTVTVSVSDGTSTPDATLVVTITVTDLNEKPVFLPNPFIQTIPENTPANQDIGRPFTATDEDDDTLTYGLGGTDQASFAIDPATGQLKTAAVLNFEGDRSYSVTISVTDSRDDLGNPESTGIADQTIAVTVSIINQNEVPRFDAETTTREVPENTLVGEDIGQPVGAIDPDTDDTLTYSLTGTDAASRSILTKRLDKSSQGLHWTTRAKQTDLLGHRVGPTTGKMTPAPRTWSVDDSIEVTITRYQHRRRAGSSLCRRSTRGLGLPLPRS